MKDKKKNLSDVGPFSHNLSSKTLIGIVVSEWNPEVTEALCQAALKTLSKQKISKKNILIYHVPGSFELPLGAQYIIENKNVDAVICLGCVIQGETRHFDFICQAVSQQIAHLNTAYNVPVIFGVLTTDTTQQAIDRSGGKHGNKGTEAAIAALKMLQLRDQLTAQ